VIEEDLSVKATSGEMVLELELRPQRYESSEVVPTLQARDHGRFDNLRTKPASS
jgi:hypothetical protein